MLILVDTGFNFHYEELTEEFVIRFSLNPIQLFYLKQGMAIVLSTCTLQRKHVW